MARRCGLSGKSVQVGNNVSHAHNKTRRRFLPNLQRTSVFSDALGRSIRIRLSMASMRSLEKKGGLDSYLIDCKDKLLPPAMVRLKKQVKKIVESRAK